MATTYANERIRIVGRAGATSDSMEHGIVAASQTFKEGDVVEDNGAGSLQIAADSTTSVTVLGLASHDASATTGADQAYEPFLPGTIVEANLTAAAGASHVFAQTDLFVAYGLSNNGGSPVLHTIDTANTLAGDTVFVPFRVVRGHDSTTGDISAGAVGDTNVRVLAVVIASAFIRVA